MSWPMTRLRMLFERTADQQSAMDDFDNRTKQIMAEVDRLKAAIADAKRRNDAEHYRLHRVIDEQRQRADKAEAKLADAEAGLAAVLEGQRCAWATPAVLERVSNQLCEEWSVQPADLRMEHAGDRVFVFRRWPGTKASWLPEACAFRWPDQPPHQISIVMFDKPIRLTEIVVSIEGSPRS